MAIILTIGFLAGTIDNEVNAMIFGLFVGLILGILENPLVEFIYGKFVARFYEGFIGSHLIILVILGVIVESLFLFPKQSLRHAVGEEHLGIGEVKKFIGLGQHALRKGFLGLLEAEIGKTFAHFALHVFQVAAPHRAERGHHIFVVTLLGRENLLFK